MISCFELFLLYVFVCFNFLFLLMSFSYVCAFVLICTSFDFSSSLYAFIFQHGSFVCLCGFFKQRVAYISLVSVLTLNFLAFLLKAFMYVILCKFVSVFIVCLCLSFSSVFGFVFFLNVTMSIRSCRLPTFDYSTLKIGTFSTLTFNLEKKFQS